MSNRKLDANTAASELEDVDFANEHEGVSLSDEPAPDEPDESVPSGLSGMDQAKHTDHE